MISALYVVPLTSKTWHADTLIHWLIHAHTHTHTHTHMRACTHTYTCTYTNTHIYTHTHSRMYACICAHVHSCTQANMYTLARLWQKGNRSQSLNTRLNMHVTCTEEYGFACHSFMMILTNGLRVVFFDVLCIVPSIVITPYRATSGSFQSQRRSR